MLDFLPKLAGLLLSNNADLLRPVTTAFPLPPTRSAMTPQDPSTLALAIAGITTVVLYFAASGWRTSRSDRRPALRPEAGALARQESIDEPEAPKRGAA